MHRKSFDAVLTAGGLVVAAILLVAGGLLAWGHSFVSNNVHDQLAAQKIFFPAAGSPALAPAAIGPYLNRYAGEQLTTGAQAEAYADHFINVHLGEVADGQTYAQLSTKAQADPKNAALAGQVETMFKGETLRGLLLNAYAFGKMGTIAGIAAIGAFAGAALMLLLSALGLAHLRRVSPDSIVLPGLIGTVPAQVLVTH